MSFKIIAGIDPIIDELHFDKHGLNCFTVPKYLAVAAFRSINPELFYTYLYLYQHYDFLELAGSSERALNTSSYSTYLNELEHYVLAQKLGLELSTITVEEGNLCPVIRNLLDQNMPVFVPVDRGELFYACIYQQEVDPQLLLIKGYNTNTGVFVTHDFEQNYHLLNCQPLKSFGVVYSQFYILPEILEKANLSFNKNFKILKHQLQAMQPQGTPTIETAGDAIKDIAAQFSLQRDALPSLLASKFTLLEDKRDGSIKQKMAYVNSQQILARMLSRLLADHAEQAMVEEVKKTSTDAYKSWKDFMTVLGVMEIRKSSEPTILGKQREKVIKAEQRFLQAITAL